MTYGDGIVLLVLGAVIGIILWRMIQGRKKGCGCSGCSGCPSRGSCEHAMKE